ncbi:kinase-like domain-containing protein [Phlyctochytrium arcticum]|nr:kinase-like domain-containing protein [Phlyctochytrium arcticum]
MPPPPTHTSSSPHIRHILNSYSHTPTHGSASPAAERGNSYSNPYNAISAPSPQHIPNQAASNPPECIGPYIVLKSLGSGAFSHVKLAVHSRDGRRVAIKMLEKPGISSSASSSAGPTSALKTATTEADLIASLEHPNIIRLVEILDTPTHTCLVLEYASGGELYDLIADHPNLLTEDRVRPLFRDLCIAVKYLHDNHIAHRDLKVENVLLDSSNSVKLTDFGLAQKFDPNIPLTARCGSEEYAAPELIQALPYDGRKTDLWALGIILFALLTGELPFSPRPGERPRSLFHRICRGDFHFPDEGKAGSTTAPHVSDSAKDLVRRILKPNPARRATMEEVLAHPWLTT